MKIVNVDTGFCDLDIVRVCLEEGKNYVNVVTKVDGEYCSIFLTRYELQVMIDAIDANTAD